MILTYKIKHGQDFSNKLEKARQVAMFAINNKFNLTSSSVKHIGLKSIIANQILRKYGKNKKVKKCNSVKLTVPNQGISFDRSNQTINVPCLGIKDLKYYFSNDFQKINQIEADNIYCYVSVSFVDNPPQKVETYIGVDLNATGYCCVASDPSTGKVLKLGKKAHHIHKKYKNQRTNLQKKEKFKLIKTIKNRESRTVRNLNHKISRKVVDYAFEYNAGIVLENLSRIRKTKKQAKSFRYSLHSWSFYQLKTFIEYKAKLLGVPVVKIDPAYTSQQCSKCGSLGNRNKKSFKCPACGHVEDADVNASFVIALRHQGTLQLPRDRDLGKGSADTPQEATA